MSKKTVSREIWLNARMELLAREKAFSRERDALSAARRELPLVKVTEPYVFQSAAGERSLLDLFGDKPQLLLYHFMFSPDWERGCPSCSLVAESFEREVVHLAARNTAFVAVSRAPVAKLTAFAKLMGFTFPWVSSGESRFNTDFAVSFSDAAVRGEEGTGYNFSTLVPAQTEMPGFSTFLREGSDVFHTYSTYSRGVEPLMNIYNLLDLTPLGRQEDGKGMSWVKHRDRY